MFNIKLSLFCIVCGLAAAAFKIYAFEENLERILSGISTDNAYLEIKGSGYSVIEYNEEIPAILAEWHFTTILSVNPSNPKLYVSFEPFVHPRVESDDVIRFSREVWYDGDIWTYSEQRLDEEMNPSGLKRVYLENAAPHFMGGVDRDGDYFGLTFIPWRYGVLDRYSLIKSFAEIDTVPFTYRKIQTNENSFSYELKNACNETTIVFNGSAGEPIQMKSVEEIYNLCHDSKSFSSMTTEFSDFIEIPDLHNLISIPTAFEKSFRDNNGDVTRERFGKLESVRIVSEDYVNQRFDNNEALTKHTIFDKISGLMILPNGETRSLRR